jgi:hypothetical protein
MDLPSVPSYYARTMTRAVIKREQTALPSRFAREEWDWPARGRYRRYRTIDAYHQPSGWNSPGAKKAINIYWQVTIGIIKALVAVPLSAMVVGSAWLIWILISKAKT